MESLKDQVGGDHYHKLAIQPIEYISANRLGYCEGNIVKYVTRWKDKGGLEDLLKAQQYLAFLIESATKNDGMVAEPCDIVTDTDPGDEHTEGRVLPWRAIADPYPDNSGGL